MTADTNTTAAQPLDLDRLESLARAATPGEWKREDRTVYVLEPDGWRKGIEQFRNRFSCSVSRDGSSIPQNELLANAQFIAAANPATILALIAQARAAQPESATGTTGASQNDDDEFLELPKQPEELRARWKCEDCDGRGHDGESHWQGHFQPPEPAKCSACDGSGWVDVVALLPEQVIEAQRKARDYQKKVDWKIIDRRDAEIADLRAQLAAKGQGELVSWEWLKSKFEEYSQFQVLDASGERDDLVWKALAKELFAPASAQPDRGVVQDDLSKAANRVYEAAYSFNASKFVLGSKEHHTAAHEYQAAQDALIRLAIASPASQPDRGAAQDERALFEAAMPPHHPRDRNMPDGSYNSPYLHVAWEVWQLARGASPASQPVAPEVAHADDRQNMTLEEMKDLCRRDPVAASGLPLKAAHAQQDAAPAAIVKRNDTGIDAILTEQGCLLAHGTPLYAAPVAAVAPSDAKGKAGDGFRKALEEIAAMRGKGDCATDVIDIAESALAGLYADEGKADAGNAGGLTSLRAQIKEWQNNLETFGPYSQEAARVALDGVLDMIEELEANQSPATSAADAKDAARIDWMEDSGQAYTTYDGKWVFSDTPFGSSDQTLREAIDAQISIEQRAAMAAAPSSEKGGDA